MSLFFYFSVHFYVRCLPTISKLLKCQKYVHDMRRGKIDSKIIFVVVPASFPIYGSTDTQKHVKLQLN